MLKGGPAEEEELRRREEALTLETVERNLDLERLEMREHQVARAEDEVGAREAWVQVEIDRRVAEARAGLERGYEERLELIKAKPRVGLLPTGLG